MNGEGKNEFARRGVVVIRPDFEAEIRLARRSPGGVASSRCKSDVIIYKVLPVRSRLSVRCLVVPAATWKRAVETARRNVQSLG